MSTVERQSAAPAPEEAWADRVADRIEEIVTEIRRRSYSPLRTLATAVVLGILIGVMTALTCALLLIAVNRALDSYFFPQSVWEGYLIVGGIFSVAGLLVWTRRRSR